MDSMKQKFNAEQYNDSGFAIGFLVHIAAVVGWIGFAAASGKFAQASKAPSKAAALLEVHAQPLDAAASVQFLVLCLMASVLFALIWAGIWLLLLQAIPAQVVTAAIVTLPVMFAVLTVLCFACGNLLAGALMTLLTLGAAFWVWCVWDRIDFTSHVVKTASNTFSKSSTIFGVALMSVLAQAVWSLVWLLAVFPLCNGTGTPTLWPLFLFSYYWSCQVVAYVLYVTCAGVMARWYYNVQTDEAVSKSLKQACSLSFGSICFGSLIMALIQTLKTLCNQAQQDAEEDGNPAGACLACVAAAILSCIEDMVQIFNAYAYAYIAIYGMPFWEAGSEVIDLMQESDCESLVHFSLINVVSFFGTLTGGFFTCGASAFLAWRVGLTGMFLFAVAFLGFCTGVAVLSVVSRMMEAGSITLFVCFAEEPGALGNSDADLADLFNERKGLVSAEKKV